MNMFTRVLLLAVLATFSTGCNYFFDEPLTVAEAVKKGEIDSLINDFLAIQPRTKWPVLMESVDEAVLVREFVAGAQSEGLTLSPRQTEMVRLVVVPRLMERMARTVEGIDPKATSLLDALAIAKKMETDTKTWFHTYTSAVAELLSRAEHMPELDRVL